MIVCPCRVAYKSETMWRHITPTRVMIYIVLSGFLFRSATLYGGNMQNAVVDLSTSIVEFGRLDINPYYFNSPDIAKNGPNYYSGMAPGSSILGVPLYAAAKLAWSVTPAPILDKIEKFIERKGLITYSSKVNPYYTRQTLAHALMSLCFGFLGGALAFWIVARVALFLSGDEIAARQTGCIYAFGTVMIFYHNSYYTQSIGVLLLLIAVYFAIFKQTPLSHALCGLFCGLAGTVDYPYLVYGAALVGFNLIRLWRARRLRFALIFLAGYLIPVLALFGYHWICFGGPLRTPYGFRVHNELHSGSRMAGISLFRPDRFLALLFSPFEGVITLMPFVIFFPFGAWHYFKKYIPARDEHSANGVWFVASAVVIILLAGCYFVSIPWISYMTAYGPRFFLAALPFLTILAYPHDRRLRIPFWILVGYSVIVNQLNMVSMNVPNYIYQTIAHPPAPGLTVTMFQIKKVFPPAQGLIVLIALHLILIAFIFAVPAYFGSKKIKPA